MMEIEVGGLNEAPRRPKFEKDFIMLSEFSELVGPIPVCIIPDEKAKGSFNVNHFSVRIMSSDFQGTSGKLIGEDTQVILSESQDCAYAYVHYFSLNDNRARGFVRQFCLSYITSSPSKIVDNFNELLEEFGQVTALLKVANHILFQKDILCHQADLDLTWKLLQDEGYTDVSKTDTNQLYSGFDFTRQDVPERDPVQVTKDMEETKEILTAINDRLEMCESKRLLEELQKLRGQYREKRHMERERSHTFPQDSGSPCKGESGFTSYVPTFECGSIVSNESLSSSDSIEYQPQRVMTHIVHKFERRLRTLDELSPRACPIAMDRLIDIHKHFCRSELTLEMEKEEILLLDPRSSLLTIGRVPVLNMLQDYSPFSQDQPLSRSTTSSSSSSSYQYDESYLLINQRRRISSVISSIHYPVPYRITSSNTWGLPNQSMENSVVRVERQANSGFDSSFLEDKLGLKYYPLYMNSTSQYRRSVSDSFTTIEPLLNYDQMLSSSRLDTDSDTNLLVIPPEDDDGTSRESANFATPEGLTPKSSDEEGEGLLDQYCTRTGGRIVGGGGDDDDDDGGDDDDMVSQSENGNAVLNGISNGCREQFLEPGSVVTSQPVASGSVVPGSVPPSLVVSSQPDSMVPSQPGSVVPSQPVAPNSVMSTPSLVVPSQPGLVVRPSVSLECSGNSSSHYQMESGSQSTLTDSKEDFIQGNKDIATDSHHHKTGLTSSQGTDNDNGVVISSGNGHQGYDMPDGAAMSTTGTKIEQLNRPGLSSPRAAIFPINSSGWETLPNDIVTFDPIDAGVVAPRQAGGGGNDRTRDTNNKTLSSKPGKSKTNDSRENSLSGSGRHNNTTTLEQATELRMHDTHGAVLSNGGSEGLGGGGGGVQSWAGKKKGTSSQPPSDLTLRRDQSLPDVYHTPLDSMNFFASSKSAYKFSPPEYQPPFHSLSPSRRSYASITSMDTMFSERSLVRGPSVLEVVGKTVLPLVSTVDFIECSHKFKPGKGIINFCKTTPIVTDLIYCLLQGRPLVLIGKSSDQNVIRRIIRVLWLFVPGHSSQKQIIPWQEAPLDIRDLSRVKLIGLSSEFNNSLGPHIKRYISSWDYTTGKLSTPSYHGELLKPIVSRTKDKKNEEVFLTHIHSVLLDIAMKAFVYYHGYCTLMPNNKKPSPYASSPKKCHTVLDKTNSRKQKMAFLHKLGVKNGDEDIIEYFVDVIREQQLVEWGMESVNGSPLDGEPVRMHLQTKHCTESFCKPKRPY